MKISINKLTIVIGSILFAANTYAAPDLPRLNQSDLIYKGAFRVPKGDLGNGESLLFNGSPIGYNPVRNSLLITTKNKQLVELSIPQPVISSTVGNLNTASVIQIPGDVTNAKWDEVCDGICKATGTTSVGNGASPGGILYFGGKLIVSSWGYYDANNDSRVSHGTVSPNWATTGGQFSGFYTVGNPLQTGMIGGYMAGIPTEWQADFGGPALTGLGSIAIFNRTSAGPSAYVFDPSKIGVVNPVPATPVVQYPEGHRTFGGYEGTSLYYNMGTQLRGLVFPKGTRSVLFFGRQGLGSTGQGNGCYGSGTGDLSQAKNSTELCAWFAANPSQTSYNCGGANIPANLCAVDPCCYDKSSGGKGDHAYPYVYYVWAYDANDLLSAKSGTNKVSSTDAATGRFVTDTPAPMTPLVAGQTINPWNVKPYGLWTLSFPNKPNTDGDEKINGAAYDPNTQRIYINQGNADMNGPYDPYPLIQVYEVKALITPVPAPPVNVKGTVVK